MRRLRLVAACVLALAPLAAAKPARGDDWEVKKNPFDKKVVAQWKGYLARDPHDANALANLLKLYRSYSTVAQLQEEYQKQVDKNADDWAATVVLGKLYHQTGDDQRALDLFEKAVAKKATDAQSWLLIGELLKNANKPKEARAAYEKALANAGSGKDAFGTKKKALRALADIALATSDYEGADKYFKQFLDLDPKNAQLWIERGDAMLAAGKRDVALESYAAAEKLLGGDPAKRVEVVARRGQALEGMGKDDEAVAEYRRAISLAPKGYYLEVELTGRIVDIYRRKQALPQLLALYEKQWPEGSRGHFEWSTLGKLYEETGAQDKAIAALKRAVAKSPWELDTQRRLIQLLENSGKEDEALAQYEAVVRAAPGEARFQLELAERYQRRGREKQALSVLDRLQARFPADAGVLSAIADLYQRWGKEDAAIKMYEKLALLEPDDPTHLATLGEQYWQKGDHARAMATWKRLVNANKPAGYAKLGELMKEHGNKVEALANYNKAIQMEPKNPEWYRGRADYYEGDKQYELALKDWEMVLSLLTKPSDKMARKEARKKYVAVVTRWGAREQQYKKQWTDGWANGTGDLEKGYFLAEYYTKKGSALQSVDKDQPTKTLEQLHKRTPEDQDVIWDLEKQFRQHRRFDDAVALMLELAKAVPPLERQCYQEISAIMTDARRDDDAIKYAKMALDKSPNNPAAYQDLAERYVEMQRFSDAIDAYEKSLKLSAQNTKAQFALAQLYIQSDQPMKAAQLLRDVLRTAQQPPDIERAGRAAIDLEEMTDTLGELEKVLSPLSFMMGHRPEFRRVLVDLYLRYVPRLVARERHGNDEVKKAAHAELMRIGGHGLQPLLEALRDEKDTGQQRVAVAVLGHLGNKGAAAPLVHMARQEPPKDSRHIGTLLESVDREVRIDALVAAGRLGDPKVLADVIPLMDHPEVAMREAATFTIGRTGDRRAVPPLLKALGDRRPSVQTLACLGLAQIDDPRVVGALSGMVADTRKDDATRAACAYGLGVRKASGSMPALLAALVDNRGDTQRLAAWSLGQLGDAKTLGPLIRAYFARAGRSSDELVWAIGRVTGAGLAPSQLGPVDEYPLNRGKYDPVAAIALLPGNLPSPPIPAKLVTEHAEDIAKGLLDALAEHRDVVVSVLADLDSAPTQLALGALSAATTDAKVAAALARIGEAIAPQVTAQLSSDDPKVRALAVSVLAKMDNPKMKGVDAAVAKALDDQTDQVRAAAMNAVTVLAVRRGTAPAPLVASLAKTLANGPRFDRREAALALGKLAPGADGGALIKAAGDSSSFVREAVAQALSGRTAALDALLALSRDEVPQVRAAAARSLGKLSDERARKRRGELAGSDPDKSVREAAGGS
jgi:tetratricopeptide (TPR) repeat protein/HEAT repeat protein